MSEPVAHDPGPRAGRRLLVASHRVPSPQLGIPLHITAGVEHGLFGTQNRLVKPALQHGAFRWDEAANPGATCDTGLETDDDRTEAVVFEGSIDDLVRLTLM